ncbi:MAG: TlpA disulfide reductase family protein [Deinococcales bacterium]
MLLVQVNRRPQRDASGGAGGVSPRRRPTGLRPAPRRLARLALAAVAFAALGVPGRVQARGQDAPDFTIVAYQGEAALGGDSVSFDSLLGNGRPVVLNFWAGLCPPCRTEMPGFQKLHARFGDKVLFVGVDLGDYLGLGSHTDARSLLQDDHISYPAGYAASRAPIDRYSILAMPTTVVFDAEGARVAEHVGYYPADQLGRLLTGLLDQARATP